MTIHTFGALLIADPVCGLNLFILIDGVEGGSSGFKVETFDVEASESESLPEENNGSWGGIDKVLPGFKFASSCSTDAVRWRPKISEGK